MTEKQLYTVTEFCAAYGIGRTTFYAEVKAKRLRMVKLGSGSRVTRTDAEAWVAQLPQQSAVA